MLYQDITENGFTQEFEHQVIQSARTSEDKDLSWKTETDITHYFQKLDKKIKE